MIGFRFLVSYLFFVGIDIQAQSVKSIDLAVPAVFFTDPDRFEAGEKDRELLQQIANMIAATPPGEEITVCVFKFGLEDLAKQLVEAQNRGVKVRIIMNKGDTSKDTNKEVKDFLKTELADFHYIENDITDKAIIHNKFILFSGIESTTGPVHNIILQTSSNFQKKGTKKLQDMLIISSHELYYCFLDFWYEIKVLGAADELENYQYFRCSDKQRREAFFFPKRRDKESFGSDNILKILKEIEKPGTAEIRFAHGKWDENRDELAEQLDRLRDKGAKVEVVTNYDVDKEVRKELQDLRDDITYLDNTFNLHTKFFLVKDGNSKQVWTGSHNLTKRSLRENFEVLLKIEHEQVYRAYLEYFNKIKQLENP